MPIAVIRGKKGPLVAELSKGLDRLRKHGWVRLSVWPSYPTGERFSTWRSKDGRIVHLSDSAVASKTDLY